MSVLRGLGDVVVRRPWRVIAGWAILALVGLALAGGLGDRLANRGYMVPGSGSDTAHRLESRYFAEGNGTPLLIAMTAARPSPIALRGAVERSAAAIRGRRDVGRLGGPVTAPDGRAAILPLVIDLPAPEAEKRVHELRAVVDHASPGATIIGEVSGYERYTAIARQDLARTDRFSFPASLLLLLLAFVSVVAAMVPIASAAVALSLTFGGLYLLTRITDMSVFATNTAVVLGIGLSIDYALFLVVRHRELLSGGASVADAVRGTLTSTGRTVAISGLTISGSLAALLGVGVGMFASLSLGAMFAAFAATVTSLTLVPAILVLLGHRIDSLSLGRAARAAAEARLWHRLGEFVLRRRVLALCASTLVLLALAAPMLDTKIAVQSLSLLPHNDPVRVQTARVAHSFGGGAAGPVEIITRSPLRVARIAVGRQRLKPIMPPVRGHAGWWQIDLLLSGRPDSEGAERVVRKLRTALAAADIPNTYVGGQTAVGVDLKARIDARTPLVVGIALFAAAIALAIGFRSVLVPVKAVLTTALSAGASLGIVTLVFQLLGDQPALADFLPLLVFATVFGLSMDYEVFLVSRVRAEYLATGDNDAAIRTALVRTGRSITLAASVMVAVFLLFAASSLVTFQEVGVGLAAAVLLDATLVRGVLVPAAMSLLGKWNWWFPGGPTAGSTPRPAAGRSRVSA